MKAIILVLILTTAAFGQDWKFIATDRQHIAEWYYQTVTYDTNGDVEVWLKIVLTRPTLFLAQHGIPNHGRVRGMKYSLQYTIFHCNDIRMSTEKTTLYRANGSVIISGSFFAIDREPIEPGSVNAQLLQFFCK